MLIEERMIEVDQLRMGMYVCRLDCDWTETPFALQGFLLETDEQLQYLRHTCRHVYIDVEQGIDADEGLQSGSGDHQRRARRPGVSERGREYVAAARDVAQELPRASQALERVTDSVTGIIEAFRSGKAVGEAEIEAAVEPVVASLARNPDAFFWLQALRKRGEYAYSHAVNCCALAATLGRQLGLPESELHELAKGGMLLDIGMTELPLGLLSQQGELSPENRRLMQGHVEHGVQMYQDADMGSPSPLSMLAHHHERHNGSGYPQRLAGADIPLPARIAGIVDSYDAMVSDRPYRRAMPRHDALQSMYRERGSLYQEELIEQFMHALGVYPVGSLVELSNGEVAIIMALNPARRLRPAMLLLTDAEKKMRSHFEPLDLMLADRAQLPQSSLNIVRSLEPGAYGLEPSELYL